MATTVGPRVAPQPPGSPTQTLLSATRLPGAEVPLRHWLYVAPQECPCLGLRLLGLALLMACALSTRLKGQSRRPPTRDHWNPGPGPAWVVGKRWPGQGQGWGRPHAV